MKHEEKEKGSGKIDKGSSRSIRLQKDRGLTHVASHSGSCPPSPPHGSNRPDSEEKLNTQ